jgi:muramoyltetrapeptide carboxypeptidase
MSRTFLTPLKRGDKVIILSTARKITIKELAIAEKTLSGWGLKVIYGKNIFNEYYQMAGSDEERTNDFQSALDDKTIKAIICARGGYGSVRIVNQLNFKIFSKNPKWLVGYSDVTVLHNVLARKKINMPSLHSSMPINFPTNTKQALETLKQALFGATLRYKVAHHLLNRTGSAEGKLVGGNLSVLYSLQGTKFEIDTRGKILFIEDIDEYLYHIDRMIMNFKLSGKLKKIKGLVVGSFTQIKDNIIPFGKTAEEIIYDAVKEYDYPVCFNFPAGHLDDNRAIYLNTEARLEVNKYSHLAFGNLN